MSRMPNLTSMFEPCELYMLKDHLIEVLRLSLQSIANNRVELDTTPEKVQETELAIRQRQELLAWAESQPQDLVYIALYPTTEEEEREPRI